MNRYETNVHINIDNRMAKGKKRCIQQVLSSTEWRESHRGREGVKQVTETALGRIITLDVI